MQRRQPDRGEDDTPEEIRDETRDLQSDDGLARTAGHGVVAPARPPRVELADLHHGPPANPRHGQRGEDRSRSEEHTSELQSPCNLVCRLLLEKKKKSATMLILH